LSIGEHNTVSSRRTFPDNQADWYKAKTSTWLSINEIIRWLRLAEYNTGSVRHNLPRPTADQVGYCPTRFGYSPTRFRYCPTRFGSSPTRFGCRPTKFGYSPTGFGGGLTGFGCCRQCSGIDRPASGSGCRAPASGCPYRPP